MTSGSVIRLLVIGDSPEESERFVSLLRNAGYVARTTQVDDPEKLSEALNRAPFDIVIHMLSCEDVNLDDTVEAVQGRELPVPVLAAGEGRITVGEAMARGAADRLSPDDDDHARLAVLREFDNVRTRREVMKLHDAYKASEQRAGALMKTSRDAIAYLHDGMHVMANDAYLHRFGYDQFNELEGLPMMDMVSAQDQEKLKGFLRGHDENEEAVGTLELTLEQADGKQFQAEVEFSRASIEGEACSQIIIRDQASTEELEKQIHDLSQRDAVTGAYNRQYFMELLDGALWEAEQKERHGALLQLQIDGFRSIRDRVGVRGSDQVLSEIAGVLRRRTTDADTVAKLEGPVFAILTSRNGTETLDRFAASLRAAIREQICEIDGNSITATTSIGIAEIDGSTSNANDIISRAERALAEAAELGPDEQRIYQPKPGEMSQKQIDQQWVLRIREILKNDQLTLLYQPIVDLSGDNTARYQVQLYVSDGNRLAHDEEMLAAADRTGMSKGIDRWVVLHALKKLAAETKTNPKTVLFIPLSGHSFDDTGLFRWIQERLKALKLPRGSVVFEADAAAAATRLKQAAAFSVAVHKIGCRFSLSRFGHGKDPFQILRHIQADYLRLHEEFTHDLAQNEQNQQALRELTSRAREMKRTTICPGISDAASLTVIWSVGTDMIQGEFLQEATPDLGYDFAEMAM